MEANEKTRKHKGRWYDMMWSLYIPVILIEQLQLVLVQVLFFAWHNYKNISSHFNNSRDGTSRSQRRFKVQSVDVPLSSSGASMVSESSWPSARPVQISCWRTASAMGITMAVVDVLLSHMDRNTVQHMKPSTNLMDEEKPTKALISVECSILPFVCGMLTCPALLLRSSPCAGRCVCAGSTSLWTLPSRWLPSAAEWCPCSILQPPEHIQEVWTITEWRHKTDNVLWSGKRDRDSPFLCFAPRGWQTHFNENCVSGVFSWWPAVWIKPVGLDSFNIAVGQYHTPAH